MGEEPLLQLEAVGRVGVFAIQGGYADLTLGQELRVDELLGLLDALHAADSMRQGNQAVCLATAVLGVQANDRVDFTANA